MYIYKETLKNPSPWQNNSLLLVHFHEKYNNINGQKEKTNRCGTFFITYERVENQWIKISLTNSSNVEFRNKVFHRGTVG